MARTLLFNKPFGVLSQFTDSSTARTPGRTLSEFINVPDVYPAGRLDKDSEGLMVLTSDGRLQARLSRPRHKVPKLYWVQIEGLPAPEALDRLRRGVTLKDGMTRPAGVARMDPPPGLWPRIPPIRVRHSVPDCWIAVTLREGRNRQVRRMTAAVGHPTLRLIRAGLGTWRLDGLAPGAWQEIDAASARP